MAAPVVTDKVFSTIKKYSMLSGGEQVLVGLSGGPDSVCLLTILRNLVERLKLGLSAVYIDHGMRPGETETEIAFCEDLCRRFNIPFVMKPADVKTYAREQKLNIQEAGRQLRYRVYDEVAYEIKANRIALGHTADDQAETVMMRLFRGAGSTGLGGIPPVRKHIIRPLIDIERSEIQRFLHDENIDYVIDSSNLKKDYLRNRIRISLIPVLRDFNQDIIGTLSKTAAIFRDEERYFDSIVTKSLMKLISRKTDTRIELFLAPFEIMDTVIRRRVLRRAIDETKGLRGIGFMHIEDIIRLIKDGSPGDRLYLPKGVRVIKEYSTLIFTSEPPARLHACTLNVPGETILKESGVVLKAALTEDGEAEPAPAHDKSFWTIRGVFDADKVQFPLIVRARENGDFFHPAGFGRRKKLQDFFVDLKIPRDERDRVPLILSGDDIIWVVGYRGDERFRVTGDTKNILQIEIKKMRD